MQLADDDNDDDDDDDSDDDDKSSTSVSVVAQKKMYQCIKFPSLYLKKLLWPADEKTMMGNLQLVRVKDTFFFATTEIRRANLNDNMMIDRQK